MQCPVEKQKGIFCKDHPEEDCTFVCGLCNILICDDCIDSGIHNDHNILSIKNFIKEVDLDGLRESCEEMEGQKIRKQALAESDKQNQRAVDAINLQANQIISEINQIKENRIQECESKKEENIVAVNNVVTMIDPSDLSEKIKNLPKKGGRTQYAEVAHAILDYQRTVDSADFESKCSGVIYIPKFTPGKFKTTRLEKLFGMLDFEEDVEDLFGCGSDSTESSDNNEVDKSDSEPTEEETGSDFTINQAF